MFFAPPLFLPGPVAPTSPVGGGPFLITRRRRGSNAVSKSGERGEFELPRSAERGSKMQPAGERYLSGIRLHSSRNGDAQTCIFWCMTAAKLLGPPNAGWDISPLKARCFFFSLLFHFAGSRRESIARENKQENHAMSERVKEEAKGEGRSHK